MLRLQDIKKLFEHSSTPTGNEFEKYILKEYLQLEILDYLSKSKYLSKLAFIGGTALRIVFNINRFSEDLDFDCKGLSRDEFMEMTNDIILYLGRMGYNVTSKEENNPKLKAFRRNILFPELLYNEGVSNHKEERFLIKIEAQDQGVDYDCETHIISQAGFYFPINTPSTDVLCAMKVNAFLNRTKGRDIYDLMFLLGQTSPNLSFLDAKMGINDPQTLWTAILDKLSSTDLAHKSRDFSHLLFNVESAKKILAFKQIAQIELDKAKKTIAHSNDTLPQKQKKKGRRL